MYVYTYVRMFMHDMYSSINLPLTITLNSNITVAQMISVRLIKPVAISSQSNLSGKSSDEEI